MQSVAKTMQERYTRRNKAVQLFYLSAYYMRADYTYLYKSTLMINAVQPLFNKGKIVKVVSNR